MTRAFSEDLRERVVSAAEGGMPHRAVARLFCVSVASVSIWRKLKRETGRLEAKAMGGDRRSHRAEGQREAIMAALGPEGDRTIDEVRATLREEQGESFGYGTIQRFFVRHKITRKKNSSCKRAGSS